MSCSKCAHLLNLFDRPEQFFRNSSSDPLAFQPGSRSVAHSLIVEHSQVVVNPKLNCLKAQIFARQLQGAIRGSWLTLHVQDFSLACWILAHFSCLIYWKFWFLACSPDSSRATESFSIKAPHRQIKHWPVGQPCHYPLMLCPDWGFRAST